MAMMVLAMIIKLLELKKNVDLRERIFAPPIGWTLACSGCKVIVLDDQDDDEEEEHDDDENHNDDDKHNYKKWIGYDQAVIHVMITVMITGIEMIIDQYDYDDVIIMIKMLMMIIMIMMIVMIMMIMTKRTMMVLATSMLPIDWSQTRLCCSGCDRCSSSLLKRQNAQTITLH